MEITFTLADFEGPLDLLLALIAKNRMSLYDIRIMDLIDQYLAVVEAGRAGGIEAASEFVEMAARLIYMKSVFLLPRTEEQERLRQELTGQLVEYGACKEAAARLAKLAQGVFLAVRAPVQLPADASYRLHHPPQMLLDALRGMQGRTVARRAPRQEQFAPIVSAPAVSVGSRIVHVLRRLVHGQAQRLQSLFDRRGGRSQAVATFLAVLELMSAGRVRLDESGTLTLCRRRGAGVPPGP